MSVREVYEALLSIIYPDRCLFCGEILEFNNKKGICESCLGKCHWLNKEICNKCGKPLEKNRNNLCYDCTVKKHYYNKGRALWVYEGEVKNKIQEFKYYKKKWYKKAFIYSMTYYYRKYLNWPIDIIVPVPLFKGKLKQRKYNQSNVIAKGLACELSIPVCEDLLIRIKNTKPQKDLSEKERIDNIKEAFIYNAKYNYKGFNVLLIDDIYTTGSTVDECSKVLINNGIDKVFLLSLSIGRGL